MKKKHPTQWLDRRIAAPGPYMTLCLNESEYDAAMDHLKLPHRERPSWVGQTAHATAHFLNNDVGETVVVVCIRDWEKRSGVEVAGLLVHESVHIWQDYCDRIGEKHPGAEQEAYAVQSTAQELMAEFARRVHPK